MHSVVTDGLLCFVGKNVSTQEDACERAQLRSKRKATTQSASVTTVELQTEDCNVLQGALVDEKGVQVVPMTSMATQTPKIVTYDKGVQTESDDFFSENTFLLDDAKVQYYDCQVTCY